MSGLADCDMCGTQFVSWKPPDVVCKPCADAFVKFFDDTIIEGLEDGGTQDGERDFPGPPRFTRIS